MERFQEYLQEAEKNLNLASHMAYVTYPLIKEKRLLLKILTETHDSLLNLINSVLQYEYLQGRITLTKDAQTNLGTFVQRCSVRYGITTEEIRTILRIIELTKKHKKSPLEFIRNEKVVIMLDDLKVEIITLEKTKEFLLTSKNILLKVKSKMNREYIL